MIKDLITEIEKQEEVFHVWDGDDEGFKGLCEDIKQFPISWIEAALKEYKAENERLKASLMDEMMTMGITEMKLQDGRTAKIQSEMNVKISDRDKIMLVDWLRRNGLGYVAKTKLYLDKSETSPQVLSMLSQAGVNVFEDVDMSVQTLKKALRQHQEQTGELPPPEAATVTQFTHVVIKEAKGATTNE